MNDEDQVKREGAALESRVRSSRGKTWDECSIEERIERLRRSQQEVRAWLEMMQNQLRNVPPHQHGAQGQIMVEQHHFGNVGAGVQGGQRPFDPLD